MLKPRGFPRTSELVAGASAQRGGGNPPRQAADRRPSSEDTASGASFVSSPYAFDPASETWRAGGSLSHPLTRQLRAVTWNIWLGEHRWTERLDALITIVGFYLPDLIGLQEVTPRQLDRLLKSDWVRTELTVSDATGETLRPHGVLLLSRLPILHLEVIQLPSRRHRKLLLADVDTLQGPLRVAVAHLESGGEVGLRERQLAIVRDRLRDAPAAMLMGDLNFDADRDPERRILKPHLQDCWRSVHGELPGSTLDPGENSLRAAIGAQRGPMRCDCVMLSQDRPSWRAGSIWRLGVEPIAGGEVMLYPSDHFGVAAELTALGEGVGPLELGRSAVAAP